MGIEETFDQACRQVFADGLKAGLVTDKDGVVILKSTGLQCDSFLNLQTKFCAKVHLQTRR